MNLNMFTMVLMLVFFVCYGVGALIDAGRMFEVITGVVACLISICFTVELTRR